MHEYDIVECIREAHNKLLSAESKFNYATENDVQVAIAELNAAKVHLNRLYEIAKKEGIRADYSLYKNDLPIRWNIVLAKYQAVHGGNYDMNSQFFYK